MSPTSSLSPMPTATGSEIFTSALRLRNGRRVWVATGLFLYFLE
jgi:hypothetical protein